jgi:hypothetical protein
MKSERDEARVTTNDEIQKQTYSKVTSANDELKDRYLNNSL